MADVRSSIRKPRGAVGIRSARARRQLIQTILSVVLEGVRLTVVGIPLGIPATVAGARGVAALLFGVAPMDPLTMGGAGATLVAVGTLAAIVPAFRAATAEPIVALQAE